MAKLTDTPTSRGFSYYKFIDGDQRECSLQKSSVASREMIWLGCNEIGLKKEIPGRGFIDIDTTSEGIGRVNFIANTRMHLTQDQVAALLPILQRFVETGEIYEQQHVEEEEEKILSASGGAKMKSIDPAAPREILIVGGNRNGTRVQLDGCVDEFIVWPQWPHACDVYKISILAGNEKYHWIAHPPNQSWDETIKLLMDRYSHETESTLEWFEK